MGDKLPPQVMDLDDQKKEPCGFCEKGLIPGEVCDCEKAQEKAREDAWREYMRQKGLAAGVEYLLVYDPEGERTTATQIIADLATARCICKRDTLLWDDTAWVAEILVQKQVPLPLREYEKGVQGA